MIMSPVIAFAHSCKKTSPVNTDSKWRKAFKRRKIATESYNVL